MWSVRRPLKVSVHLALGIVLALSSWVGAARLDTDSGKLFLAPRDDAPDAERLRAAILSIHAFVEQNREGPPLKEILDHVVPMPPAEAAAVIKKDASPLGDLHRRRALLRLLTWVRDVPGVPEAVEVLAGSRKKADLYARLSALDLGGACQAIETQVAINGLVNGVLGPVVYKNCDKVTLMAATVVEKGGNIGIASQVIAEGSLDGARKGLDPQRWAKCSPLWGAAYMVSVNADGTIEDNGKCSTQNHPDCMPAEGPSRPLGEAYDTDSPSPERPLFEHFVCDKTPCDVRLLLHITATRAPGVTSTTLASPPSDYFLVYDRPEQWKSFQYPPTDYGTVDVKAKDLGGGKKELTVVGDKTFGFGRWGTTSAIYYLLRRTEMANYLADLVCCPNP